jgi:hypothetical protein
MTLPITISDAPMRSTPPICIACSGGDHEQALRAQECCTCPCHGMAMPEVIAA